MRAMTDATLYDQVGGQDFFDRLVDAFYRGIATDALLGPMYPDYPDFGPGKERLSMFLAQYFGGPPIYMEKRGHPRLRMRHASFHVGPQERDRWLTHMGAAVAELCDSRSDGDELAAALMGYFVPAAEHLRNDR